MMKPIPQVSFHDVFSGLRKLRLPKSTPVIVHSSLSAFGRVRGGAESVVGALITVFDQVMMPAFTYKTMVVPESGPEDNGIQYGSRKDQNRMAEFFTPDMPVDRTIGRIAETLRLHTGAQRSSHPILSFTGVNIQDVLQRQTLNDPLEPIQAFLERDSWVLLMGVDHTTNTSIHLAERLVKRKQFNRWALTPYGVQACPDFPGCSDGFLAIEEKVVFITRGVQIGDAMVLALPLAEMLDIVMGLIVADRLALLCSRLDCERCNAVRKHVLKKD